MMEIEVVAGGSVSYAGTLKLPPGQWAAACECVDDRARTYPFVTVLTLAGQAAGGMFPWDITLEASSAQTASWASLRAAPRKAVARIKFTDSSTPPIVIWSESFTVMIKGAPF